MTPFWAGFMSIVLGAPAALAALAALATMLPGATEEQRSDLIDGTIVGGCTLMIALVLVLRRWA